jgi:hypothetical protein
VRRLVAAVAALVILASACEVVQHADELAQTTWVVVTVDGEDVPTGEILLWFEDDTATLVTQPGVGFRTSTLRRRCAESESAVTMDAESRALEFEGFTADDGGPYCDPGMAELHGKIADALNGTETWEATSHALELVGSSRVRLEPADSSD